MTFIFKNDIVCFCTKQLTDLQSKGQSFLIMNTVQNVT